MKTMIPNNISYLVNYTTTKASTGKIDPIFNLADDKVYLFGGVIDTVVHP